uniref:Uncharacterized protein n=1 Tax=Arundo donax TaxID=35708 RepID=A0A0A9C2T3_ARUDO
MVTIFHFWLLHILENKVKASICSELLRAQAIARWITT